MKSVYKYCIIFLAICLTSFVSLDDVVIAIKNGSASQLSKFFDNPVEITLPNKNNTYSMSQGELVLKDFFTTNPVKDFTIERKGENDGTQFLIGTLITKNGDFRTTIYIKQKGDKQLLQEIRFEK